MRCIIKHEGKVYDLPMSYEIAFHTGSNGDGWGYLIDTTQESTELDRKLSIFERVQCGMYEGGEMCGFFLAWDEATDEETDHVEWSWSLLPESVEDVNHIERQLIPYGRKDTSSQKNRLVFTLQMAEQYFGREVELIWVQGSTSHSFNSGSMTCVPLEVVDGNPKLDQKRLVIEMDGERGDWLYTAPSIALDDGYPEDTLYRGSGCEPLFLD